MNFYGPFDGGGAAVMMPAQQAGSPQMGPGVSAAASYSIGAQGQAVALLGLIGLVVVWYVATRSIQGGPK